MSRFMALGSRGEALIKSYETLKLVAYMPTPDDVPTIGWGHTRGVRMGDTCTVEQAQEWFEQDTARAVSLVNGLMHNTGQSLTQSQFDALVSLAFNVEASVGTGNSIERFMIEGDKYQVCQSMFLWRKQKGEDLLGLARRRVQEMSLFLEDGL